MQKTRSWVSRKRKKESSSRSSSDEENEANLILKPQRKKKKEAEEEQTTTKLENENESKRKIPLTKRKIRKTENNATKETEELDSKRNGSHTKNEENDNNDLANTQIIVFDNENEKDTRTKQMELEHKHQKKNNLKKEDDDESSSTENEKNFEAVQCPHLNRLNFEILKESLLDPSQWHCSVCSSTENVWGCLTCGHIACGRYVQEHAKQHYGETKHPIVLEINSLLCHCYACNNWVSNDTSDNLIAKLRESLEQVQSEGTKSVQQNNDYFKKMDTMNTFLKRWELLNLAKFFQKWRELVKESKKNKERKDETNTIISILPSFPRKNLLPPGKTGLRNLGNTCFMNSVIQSLSHNPAFREYFMKTLLPPNSSARKIGNQTFTRQGTIECMKSIKQKTAPSLDQISLSMQLHQLLRVLWSGQLSVVTPFSLQASVWKYVPKFKNFQQQDAQEFLVYLLERLHEELTNLDKNEIKTPSNLPSLPSTILSPKRESTAKSIITEIFQGKLVSTVKCLSCGYSSITYELFQDLILNIPVVSFGRFTRSAASKIPSCTLYDCFQNFITPEQLEGKSWFCEGCKSKQNAEKSFLIYNLPNVLCLVLKRFHWTNTDRAKINTKILFPLKDLNLASYSVESEKPKGTIYDLQSVILHHGTGFQSGHYTAYCWNSDLDTWIHFNDNTVSFATQEEVKNASGAYILFYEKKSTTNRVLNFPTTQKNNTTSQQEEIEELDEDLIGELEEDLVDELEGTNNEEEK